MLDIRMCLLLSKRRFLLFCLLSEGSYCNATTDEIGTCWPRSSTGRMVERPCPEYINGVKYNTTSMPSRLLEDLFFCLHENCALNGLNKYVTFTANVAYLY